MEFGTAVSPCSCLPAMTTEPAPHWALLPTLLFQTAAVDSPEAPCCLLQASAALWAEPLPQMPFPHTPFHVATPTSIPGVGSDVPSSGKPSLSALFSVPPAPSSECTSVALHPHLWLGCG